MLGRKVFYALGIIVLMMVSGNGWGQVGMSVTGSHTQDFNTLASSGTANAWTDNSTIANWYSQRTGTGTTYIADAGTATTGTLYSYGTGTGSERALGSIGSSNAAAGSFAHGVLLRNVSGNVISDIRISYTLEQWRNGGKTTIDTITFWYRVSSSTITALNPNSNSGWTQVTALSLGSPINTTPAGSLDGNSSVNRVSLSGVAIPGLSLANNDYIMLKWDDRDQAGSDHGLALDDVTIAWTTGSVPTVSTASASSITSASAVSGGNVTADGGATVTGRGLIYSTGSITDTNSTTGGGRITDATGGTGSFVSTLNGLSVNTAYNIRAFAVNSAGVAYGSTLNFTTLSTIALPPIVNNPTAFSLDVRIAPGDGNPAGTQYSLQDSVSGKFVSFNNISGQWELGNTEFFQTLSQWGGSLPVTVSGLLPGTAYSLRARSRNAAAVNSSFGLATTLSTETVLDPILTASANYIYFDSVCIGSSDFSLKDFTFAGSNLDGSDVTITSSNAQFTLSTSPGGPFTSALTYSGYSGGSISSSTVYVRFIPAGLGQRTGFIELAGGGAIDAYLVDFEGTGVNRPPVVVSPSSSSVASYTATLGGDITSAGCSGITERGIFWSTLNGFANGAGTKVSETGTFTTGSYALNVSGLPPGTTVYFKAFAVNGGGAAYSAQGSIVTGAPDAPVAIAATDLGSNSFTANWNAVAGADSYRLDVGRSPTFTSTESNIASEGFNNSLSLFTISSGTSGYFSGNSSATLDLPASSAFSIEGSHAIGVNNSSLVLLSSPINTSAANNASLSFRCAAFSLGATNNGMDATDSIGVDISPDGGLTFYPTLKVTGASAANAYWSYSATGVARTPYDGNSTSVSFSPAGAGSRTTDGFSRISVTNLPAVSNMVVRLTVRNNSINELWVVDSLRITDSSSATLAGYGNLTVSGTSQSVTGLASGTNYYYRVRAVAGSATSSNSNTITATTKLTQTITFDPLTARTFGAAPFTLNGTSSSSLPVSYSSSNTAVATVSGNTVTILAAGITNITASQAGDAQYAAAPSVTRTLTVSKANQTISFDSIPNKFDNDAPFTISATASSGLPVSFISSNTGVADVSGDTVTLTGTLGSATITASQAGNANYNAAPAVSRSFAVLSSAAQNQTITFDALPAKTYGDAPFQLTASASSGLTINYVSSNTSVATVSGDQITIIAPGTATITASQDGGTVSSVVYNAATPVSQTLTVGKKSLTVSGAFAINRPFDSTTIVQIDRTAETVNGRVGTDNVIVTGTTGTMANIDAGLGKTVTTAWTLNGTDTSKYSLTQPDYLTVDIFKIGQTITFPSMGVKSFTSPKFKLAAVATSRLPITYFSNNPLVATIVGDSVTITGAGTAVITASQPGDVNYNAAAAVDSTLTVNKANQTITFSTIITSKTTADAPFTVRVSASSGLPVTITSSNPSVATVTDSTVTLVGIGTTTLTATADSGTNFRSATPVVRTLNVTGPILAGWDLTGVSSTATAPATSADITAIDTSGNRRLLSRGPGATSSTGGNSFRTQGFSNNGISTANTDYFQVVIKPAFGKIVSLNSLVANLIGTDTYAAAPGVTSQFAFSLNGTNFTLIDTPIVTVGSPTSFVLNLSSVAGLQNLRSSTTVTLRYYASGQTTTGGWGFSSPNAGIFGFAVGGTSTNVLPPVITSDNSSSGTVGSAFTYNITATNSPSSYSATGLPAGLSLNSLTGVITGIPTAAGTFNATVNASNDGGTGSQNISIVIEKGNQIITFDTLAAKTFGDAAFALNGSINSGLEISYSSSNSAVATVIGNSVTIVGAGTTTITASQPGNDNYNAAVSVDQVLVVNKANQTITFGSLADRVDTVGSFTLSATSSSGLPVSFSSSNTGIITISGDTANIVGSGLVTITASQSGNGNYNAAAPVSQAQNIISTSKLDQAINFDTLSDKAYGDASFQLTATATSGFTVSYSSSNTAVATVSGDMVTIIGPGTTNITASQAGDSIYNPAPVVTRSLTVNKKTLTVSGAVAQDKVYDGNTNAVINGATLSGIVGADVVTVSGAGTFADANAGNGISVTAALVLGGADAGKYLLQQPSGLSANITQASQTIAFNALVPRTTASAPFTLNGTASSGLTVTYSSSDPLVATVSGNIVTIVGVGTAEITASQTGDGNYLPAADVIQQLVVTLAPAIVTWTFGNSSPADSLPVGGASVVPGLTISHLSRGNNNGTGNYLVTTTTTTSNYSGASGANHVIATVSNGALNVNSSAYFAFTLIPDANKRIKVDSIQFGTRSTSSGPIKFSVRTSLDNYASDVASDSALNNSTWIFKKPVTTSVTSGYASPVTFRIYGYGGSNANTGGNNWRVDDVTLALFVDSCPNPVNAGIISGSATVCAGGNSILNSNGDAGGTWSSSDPSRASVNPTTGEVTGISMGSATISYTVTGVCGSSTANYAITVISCNSVVNVKAYLQGFYTGSGTMESALLNSGVSGAASSQTDSITVEIRNGSTLALIGSPVKTILNTNGTAQAVFPGIFGSHYIVLKHRNSIETWSAVPVAIGTNVNYDFSTSASQAFGNNQAHLGAGVYGLWSGDLNQDGQIESTDYSAMENDILLIIYGYLVSDITGDGAVESADYGLIENNLIRLVMVKRPF